MSIASASIVIPAHNEERAIKRTLDVLHQSGLSGFEIIVVCNGCTDKTAEVVSAYERVKLVNTETASKTHALNRGDEIATGRYRIYMDADVTMSISDLRSMMAEMKEKRVLAITPNVKMDYAKASMPVRLFYDFWLQLPYVREGFVGGGVYMLSESGRERFRKFPNVISDDGYVRSRFERNEIWRSSDVFSVVSAPRSMIGLIKIFTRSRLGQYQLFSMFPESPSELKGNRERHRILLRHLIIPGNIAGGLIYLSVSLVCKLRARAQIRNIDSYTWETDTSSRG